MEDLSPRIQNLFDKVETLMVKYGKAREENRRLSEENAELRKQQEDQNGKIQELDHSIAVLKTAQTIEHSDADKTEIRQKVNEYIREIDRCIAMLNA